MFYSDFQAFLKVLDKEGELKRIPQSVSPILEIPEVTDRVSKQKGGGKALLFTNVQGSRYPLVMNAFGSRKRISMALGVKDIEEIALEVNRLLNVAPPKTLLEKIAFLPKLIEFSNFPPKLVRDGICQEVVKTGEEVNLLEFPILKCWPLDAGQFITLTGVITKDLDTGVRNVGMYRMQVFDEKTTAVHWQIHKDGAHHYHGYKRANKRMEVAVFVGADPATVYSGSAPLPQNIDELLLAGFIRKHPVELVKCRSVDLEVPANAEIVIEGYVDPWELRTEGPFGDHTGYYSLEDEYPVFHVIALTHRKDPVYASTIVGKPPQEDFYFGKATERIFLPIIKMQLPEIVDINFPAEGVFNNCILVSIRKEFPMHARKTMSAIWGLGQLSFSKFIIVVDDDTDVQSVSDVAWRVFCNVDPGRDMFITEGVVDALDHCSSQPLFGSKVGIDATRKVKGEGYDRIWPSDIVMSPEIKAKIDSIWSELGLD